jgi:two-component system cell cycle sensor histidine kinase/response regulator CckA
VSSEVKTLPNDGTRSSIPSPICTVLLVCEEPGLRGDLQFLLVNAGYSCLAAATPEEALAIADTAVPPVDLLVADADLPDHGAQRCVDGFRATRPRSRAIVLSGRAAPSLFLRAVRDVLVSKLP